MPGCCINLCARQSVAFAREEPIVVQFGQIAISLLLRESELVMAGWRAAGHRRCAYSRLSRH